MRTSDKDAAKAKEAAPAKPKKRAKRRKSMFGGADKKMR